MRDFRQQEGIYDKQKIISMLYNRTSMKFYLTRSSKIYMCVLIQCRSPHLDCTTALVSSTVSLTCLRQIVTNWTACWQLRVRMCWLVLSIHGAFVKALPRALSSFNVERQAYYGGTFIGNHVHSALEVIQQQLWSHACRVHLHMHVYYFVIF